MQYHYSGAGSTIASIALNFDDPVIWVKDGMLGFIIALEADQSHVPPLPCVDGQ